MLVFVENDGIRGPFICTNVSFPFLLPQRGVAHTVNFHQLLVVCSSNLILLVLVVEIVVGIDILFLFDIRVFGLADKVTEPVVGNQFWISLDG